MIVCSLCSSISKQCVHPSGWKTLMKFSSLLEGIIMAENVLLVNFNKVVPQSIEEYWQMETAFKTQHQYFRWEFKLSMRT